MFHFETRTENKHSDFRDIIKYDTHVRFSRLTMHSEIRFLILMKNTACVDEYGFSVCNFPFENIGWKNTFCCQTERTKCMTETVTKYVWSSPGRTFSLQLNKKGAQEQKQTKLPQEPILLIAVICQCLKCVVGRCGEL